MLAVIRILQTDSSILSSNCNSLAQYIFINIYQQYNKMRSKSILYFLSVLITILSSEITSFENLALTIYNDGYGIIKDARTISIDTDQSYLSVTDVAATIQPETLVFRDYSTKQKIKILQQNFENNLVGKQAILKKYLNKRVTVFPNLDPLKITPVNGTLLAYSPSCLIQTETGVEIFDEINGMMLPDLPNGLLIQPSLVWKIRSPYETKKETKCQIAYRATGFAWKADYNIIISEDETTIDLIGWVTINNYSGKKYKDAKVKLIAGDVHVVPRPRPFYRVRYAMSKGRFGRSMRRGMPLVTEKTIGDYHLYTISNRVTLNESSIKQIQFIPKIENIPIRKYYLATIFTGGYTQQEISPSNMISFNNSKENKVGMPIPKGDIKILKLDSQDNSLELLKQGSVKHSPKNQLVKLNVGTNSFIVIKKKIIRQKIIRIDGGWDSENELKIQNRFEKQIHLEILLKNSYGDNLKVEVVDGDGLEFVKQSVTKRRMNIKLKGGEQRVFRWKQEYLKSI